MAVMSVEERLSALEQELAQLKQQLAPEKTPTTIHPWEKIIGTFANSEGFDESARLGREYRESQRPKEDEITVTLPF